MNPLRLPRAICLPLALMLPLPAFAANATGVAPAAPLGSKVWAWDNLVVKPTPNGLRRDVVDQPTATLARFESHVTTLHPGRMSHAPHQHAQEEFILLKEGTLDVHINGQVTRADTGSILFFASNDLHNVTNVGDTPATYLVFNFATAATKTAPAEGVAAARLPGKLPSQIFHWNKLAFKPGPKGGRREIVNSPTCTCANLEGHITTLKAGETPHAAHQHPDEELVIVKDGTMECTVDGITQRGGPGSIFFYGSNAMHGMKNVGHTEATYYVFRVITEATPQPPAKKT
ncbi:MAG: cupin domain-containing protein [Verrucomicrobia bacterium]|nr:cupin domain-containing protein [Verrucomicrobiota bacterium]